MEVKQGKKQEKNGMAQWVLCPGYYSLAEHSRCPVNQCGMGWNGWMMTSDCLSDLHIFSEIILATDSFHRNLWMP